MKSFLKKSIRGAARYLGFDITRYRAQQRLRSDELFESWIKKLRTERPIDIVFDVGANRGQTVAHFRPIFPNATIYAFEPFEPAYRDLCQINSPNTLFLPFCLAMGEDDGYAILHENSADVTNSLLPNSSTVSRFSPDHMYMPLGTSKVPLRRIDSFCQEHGITRVDLLKIDAQGYEGKILDGCGDLLRPGCIRGLYLEALFVSLYEGQSWCGEIMEQLRECGYRLFAFSGIAYDERAGWKWADALFIGA